MIPCSDAAVQRIPAQQAADYDWQRLLASAIRDPETLLARLGLPASLLPATRAAARQFPLLVPEPFVRRMRQGDPDDPLLRQVLPMAEELADEEGYSADPLRETSATPTGGVVHKYAGRLLLIMSGGCAINCRYCFRRHFPYAENRLGGAAWQRALDYIRGDCDLREIILSGGDPLATTDKRLARMVADLETLPHLERLRIHTRLPVVIPQRVTDALCALLRETRLKTVVVLHINHPQELDHALIRAIGQLTASGARLLNQSVLLRGINDSAETLAELNTRLFDCGVQPYYLHLLDPVAGAAHFDLDEAEARRLMGELSRRLPGYMLPQLVREEPGKAAKTRIAPLI